MGRTALVLTLLVVVVLGAGAAGAWQLGLLDDLRDDDTPDSALEVPPPESLELDLVDARVPGPVLPEAPAGALRPAAVEAAVTAAVSRHRMGPSIGVAVATPGDDAWVRGGAPAAAVPRAPASTLKLLTSAAAVEAIGADTTFTTRTVLVRGGGPPTVVLVGGGDPLLARGGAPRGDDDAYPPVATLADLAARTAAALDDAGVGRVRVAYDDGLFVGPADSPAWEPDYVSGDVTTAVSALWVDEGLTRDGTERVSDPAAEAARELADALRREGTRVSGAEVEQVVTDDAADSLAEVDGPTVGQLVEHTLQTSDNESAEVLLRQVAIATGEPASFAGGARGVRTTLEGLDVPWQGVRMLDGSGLARGNRVPLTTMTAVLQLGATGPAPLRRLLSDLPVAGFSGTLLDRFTDTETAAALGYARAKTGTLTGVHAYAGVTTDASGTPLLFVAVADDVPVAATLDAREGLDAIAAELTACDCTG